MFGLDTRRQQIRADVEDWLAHHQDPRDPLTRPVELLLEMFVAATSWRAAVGRMMVATLLSATIILLVAAAMARHPNTVVMTRTDEALAMQEWVDAGVAIPLMRCEGVAFEFVNGRCRTRKGGGWLLPLAAQQRAIAARRAPELKNSAEASPWGR